MNTLSGKINEMASSKYTEQDLLNDINAVKEGDLSIKEKRAIAAKYGLQSAKAADIIKSLYVMVGDIRRNEKTSFNKDDIINFMRETDLPQRYKNAEKYLQAENPEFIKVCAKHYMDRISKTNSIMKSYADKKSRCHRIGELSYSNMYLLDTYLNFVEYLDSIDEDTINTKKEKKIQMDIIIAKLTEQMAEFKVEYLKNARIAAANIWKGLPDKIKKTKSLIEKEEKWIEDWYAESVKNRSNRFSWNSPEFKEHEKRLRHLKSEKSMAEATIKQYKTEKAYVDDYEKNAKSYFESCIVGIAERIDRKDINAANMTVSNISNDPKFFQMLITDGEKKLYARSIIAAEWSEKVTTHLRFIITDCK